ncbi:hypothetical protein J437_LFUL012044 [Ladona fulva]|uniref:Uncharacterized protein n=1 Tax=Ladona fulva TaxID=123851 RepID=A0A8K0KE47_LADFU|nr:hypothetical protein J437_LFUL012044 [Ladona fulva]
MPFLPDNINCTWSNFGISPCYRHAGSKGSINAENHNFSLWRYNSHEILPESFLNKRNGINWPVKRHETIAFDKIAEVREKKQWRASGISEDRFKKMF